MRRAFSNLALAALIFSGTIGDAFAQNAGPAKGSADHIRAAPAKSTVPPSARMR